MYLKRRRVQFNGRVSENLQNLFRPGEKPKGGRYLKFPTVKSEREEKGRRTNADWRTPRWNGPNFCGLKYENLGHYPRLHPKRCLLGVSSVPLSLAIPTEG